MNANKRERVAALAAAARAFLVERGHNLDTPVPLRQWAPEFAAAQQCHQDTAKRHLARAVRLLRGEAAVQWGGRRQGAGRPGKEEEG